MIYPINLFQLKFELWFILKILKMSEVNHVFLVILLQGHLNLAVVH